MVDVSDPAISHHYNLVREDTDATNWALFGYVTGQQKLQFVAAGTGGYNEAVSKFVDDQVLYAFVRYDWTERNRTKFVFLTWIGQGVKPLQRARISHHKVAVAGCFPGFHVELQGDTKADFAEDVLLRKLRAAGGADYDGGGRTTGAEFSSYKAKAQTTFEKPATPSSVPAVAAVPKPVAAPAPAAPTPAPAPAPAAAPATAPTPSPRKSASPPPVAEPVAEPEPVSQSVPAAAAEEIVTEAAVQEPVASSHEETAPEMKSAPAEPMPTSAPAVAAHLQSEMTEDEWA